MKVLPLNLRPRLKADPQPPKLFPRSVFWVTTAAFFVVLQVYVLLGAKRTSFHPPTSWFVPSSHVCRS